MGPIACAGATIRRRPRSARWGVIGGAVALVGVLLTGCSPGGGVAAAGAQVAATLQDFKLSTSTIDVTAVDGKVTFAVTNDGPSTHELNVDRTDVAADKLPIDGTGLFVDESSPLLHREGSVESAGLGTRHMLTLALAPGRYVLYCDLEGHYMSGMHVQLVVH